MTFLYHPLNEHRTSQRKYLSAGMVESWADGKARLWAPPFDMLPLMVRMIAPDQASGVLIAPNWPAQAWFERLRGLKSRTTLVDPSNNDVSVMLESTNFNNPQCGLYIAAIGL